MISNLVSNVATYTSVHSLLTDQTLQLPESTPDFLDLSRKPFLSINTLGTPYLLRPKQ